jgi:DNA-binding response OmpR family regulator
VSVLVTHYLGSDSQALVAALEEAGLGVSVEPRPGHASSMDAAFDVVVVGLAGVLDERLQLCQRLQTRNNIGAILVLSRDATEVTALVDAGADDFAVAPVQPAEIVVRVRIALRRVSARSQRRGWGPVEIDRVHRTAHLRGQVLALTAREWALLSCLVEAAGRVVSRADLLCKAWPPGTGLSSNLVEVHLSRLRDKLGPDATSIETVRGAGYRLRHGKRT